MGDEVLEVNNVSISGRSLSDAKQTVDGLKPGPVAVTTRRLLKQV